MPVSIIEFLKHIRDEIYFLTNESKNIRFEQFVNDEVRKRAFSRSLEIIGEAVKKIPDDIKLKYPLVEWKDIAGMRNKLIHEYFGVDYELVWDVVKSEIPELKKHIEKIIEIESGCL